MHQADVTSCSRYPFSHLKRGDLLLTSLAGVILRSSKTVPDVALQAWNSFFANVTFKAALKVNALRALLVLLNASSVGDKLSCCHCKCPLARGVVSFWQLFPARDTSLRLCLQCWL